MSAKNRARRTFNGANPTARAVLAMPVESIIERVEQPSPGGVTISDSARMQAASFGLHPYQVAEMQRKLASVHLHARDHQFTFRTRRVFFAEKCGMFTITRVQ